MADHSLVIDSQGEVWAWGDDLKGQLGLAEQANLLKGEVLVPTLTHLNDVEAVAYGILHSLAITSTGKVWSWGYNEEDQSNRTRWNRPIPTLIPTLHDIVMIACGDYHSLATNNQGHVWSWGDNSNGQLGIGHRDQYDEEDDEEYYEDNENNSSPVPIMILNLPSAIMIACGRYSSFMIDEQGNGWAWGTNHYGELGLGKFATKVTEPQRITSVTNLVSISASERYSLFLDNQGHVWLAGKDMTRLVNQVNEMIVLIAELQDIVAISTGSTHSLALDEQG
jgi:alpha-tubulin suppressor-like RCC1 family protein